MSSFSAYTPLHPSIQPGCPLCKGQGYRTRADGEHAIAERCSCVGKCSFCGESGWESPPGDRWARRTRCRCGELNLRIERFNHAGVPGRHANSTRSPDSFKPSRDVMEAMSTVSKYLSGYKTTQENLGLILWGDVGRGKTHLLVAMLRELIFRHGVTARFVEFSHLLADLKSGFDRKEGVSTLLDPLVKVDILAIDELGKGRNTEFEYQILDELVSRRYNAGRTLLATTNYPPGPSTGRATGDLVAETLPPLIDRVGERVYSRLQETCDFCQLRGEDYRAKIAARGHDRLAR